MTETTSPATRAYREASDRARRMHLTVTGGVTLVTAVVYLGVAAITAGELPATMATHFGLSGAADGFMRTPLALLFQGVAVIGVPLALLVLFAVGRWWLGEGARLVSALVSGLGAGLTAMFVAITLRHVGITDPATVALDWRVAALALGVGAVVAGFAGLVLPPALPRPVQPAVEPLAIAPSDRVSWLGRAHLGRALLVVLALSVVVVAGAAVATEIRWLWLVALLELVLVLAVASFDITVDDTGVTWRSTLGLPRGRLPLRNVTEVSVIEVNPGDFGGYGLRAVPGRVGIITRSGEALRVVHGRRELVITVDDAATAASVLAGLRLRRR